MMAPPTHHPNVSYPQALDHMAFYCQKISQKSLSPGTSGNVSIRYGDTMIITPSGFSMEEVEPHNLIQLDFETGTLVNPEGTELKPSTEWVIHQSLYQARPDIHAIVHAHPTHGTTLAACHLTLDVPLIAESIYHLGPVPLVPFVMPGSQDLADTIARTAKGGCSAMILSNHGVLTLASTLRQAYYHLELLESLADMRLKALQCPSGGKPLSQTHVDAILTLRQAHTAD